MKIRSVFPLVVLMVCFITIFPGCGELDDDSEENSDPQQGKFLLYPHSNIRYISGNLGGYLDGNSYRYYPEAGITFYIDFPDPVSGNLTRSWKLGTAPGLDEISPFDFEENETFSDWGMNVARFLSTLNPATMKILGNSEINICSADICGEMDWDGRNTYVMFDSPLEDTICEPQDDEDLYTVYLEQAPVDESVFELHAEAFENHPGIVNIFAHGAQKDDPIYYKSIIDGWDSKYFGLPVSFWKYQRGQIKKSLKIALNAKYEGQYICEFSGRGYSGELDVEIETNYFGHPDIYSYPGNTCNGIDVRVYGDVSSESVVVFYISQFWFVFEGNINNEKIIGDFYTNFTRDDMLGNFSCVKH